MKLLYKFPTRSRPDKFFEVLDNIHSLARHDDFVIVATMDTDDSTMNNPEVKERITKYPKVIPCFGESKSKIEAVNNDMNVVKDWNVCIVISDDQLFTMYGFDLEIIKSFIRYAPDFDVLMHYPDQWGKSELCVMTIMGRKLYDQLGYLYFGQYLSQYADNDLTNSCRILNKYWFRPVTIFRHNHPAFNPALPKDALYMRNMNLNMQATDNQLYIQRRDQNFGLY